MNISKARKLTPPLSNRGMTTRHLDFETFMQRIVDEWAQLSDQKREERLYRDDKRRIPVRFTLTDDHQDQAKV